MSWKISVVEDFSFFLRGALYDSVLTADLAVAGSSATVGASTNAHMYMKVGDILQLGPSSNTSNPGAVEHVEVTASTASSISFTPNCTYAYDSGDSVSGTGSGVTVGWKYDSDLSPDGTLDVISGGIKLSTAWGNPLGGYLHSTSGMLIQLVVGTQGYHHLIRDLRRPLLAEAYYRLGAYFINIGFLGSTFDMELFAGSTSLGGSSLASVMSTWTKKESVMTTAWPLTNYSDASIMLTADYGSGNTYMIMDCMYLTHALMTDGQNSGVYTITGNPIEVQILAETKRISSDFVNTSSYETSSFMRLPSRGANIVFESVDNDWLNQLEMLLYWQDLGCMLMLESDISEQPPFFGFMDIEVLSGNWRDDVMNVRLIFEGV